MVVRLHQILILLLRPPQRAALRQQISNLIDRRPPVDGGLALDQDEDGDGTRYYYKSNSNDDDKRSVTSRVGNGILTGKRPDPYYLNAAWYADVKRSLSSLAKAGQLPSKEPDANDQMDADVKRSLGSLVRSGNLLTGRNGKRNLASLRKNDMMPYSTSNGNTDKRTFGVAARNYPPHSPRGRTNQGLFQENSHPVLFIIICYLNYT